MKAPVSKEGIMWYSLRWDMLANSQLEGKLLLKEGRMSWPRPWAGIRINVLGYLWACVLFFVLGWAQSELAHVGHVYVLLDWIRDHLWKKITEQLNPLLSFSPRVHPVAQFLPKISPILLSLPSQISRSITLSLRKVSARARGTL